MSCALKTELIFRSVMRYRASPMPDAYAAETTSESTAPCVIESAPSGAEPTNPGAHLMKKTNAATAATSATENANTRGCRARRSSGTNCSRTPHSAPPAMQTAATTNSPVRLTLVTNPHTPRARFPISSAAAALKGRDAMPARNPNPRSAPVTAAAAIAPARAPLRSAGPTL